MDTNIQTPGEISPTNHGHRNFGRASLPHRVLGGTSVGMTSRTACPASMWERSFCPLREEASWLSPHFGSPSELSFSAFLAKCLTQMAFRFIQALPLAFMPNLEVSVPYYMRRLLAPCGSEFWDSLLFYQTF